MLVSVSLRQGVLELSDGSRVLAGMLPERPTLRVTSPIAHQNGRQITISSGRVYLLDGAPAFDADVVAAIARHLSLIGGACDVTAQHWRAFGATNEGLFRSRAKRR